MKVGFKGFAKGLIGHGGFKYELGKEYEVDGELIICNNGFHFCTHPNDVDKFYSFHNDVNDFAIVEILGDCKHDNGKSITNKIKVIQKMEYQHMMDYMKTYDLFVAVNGDTYYHQHRELHRDNGFPAIEYADGSKHWYVRGKLHRDAGLPAVECVDGTKQWYVEGKLHRDNGLPAIENVDGSKYWHVRGNRYRDNGLPVVEYADGTKYWYKKDKANGNDVVLAIEYADKVKQWFVEGILQRTDYKLKRVEGKSKINKYCDIK